jgi:hypothetical protein
MVLCRVMGSAAMPRDGLLCNLMIISHRATHGAAGVALSAYLLHAASNDLGGYGRLFQFFSQRPLTAQHWEVWLSVIVWLLLLWISGLRFMLGISSPGRRDVKEFVASVAVLALFSAAWVYGAFVPVDPKVTFAEDANGANIN